MTCPRCQTKIAPSDRYCINCGADIALISQNIRTADMVSEAEMSEGPDPGAWSSTTSGLSSISGSGRSPRRILFLAVIYLSLFSGSAVAAHWYLDSRTPSPSGLSLGKPRLVIPSPADQPEPTPDEPAVAEKNGAVGAPRKARPTTRRRARPRKAAAVVAPPPTAAPPATEPPTAAPPASAPLAPAREMPKDPAPASSAASKTTTPARPAAPGADAAPPVMAAAPSPPARMGSAEKSRVSLNVGSVQMVVRHRLPQLRLCYGRNIKGDAVRGTVEIRFTVNEQGKVSTASVHRGHQAVGRCIVGKLKTWQFPRPVGGGMTFIYPFVISG